MQRATALILAGGNKVGFGPLGGRGSVADMPFGGRYRVIDFALSNCVNSGLTNIAVLAQQSAIRLRKHIGRGRPWDLDRREGGVRIIQPYLHRNRGQWYRGTGEALSQNLDYIEDSPADLFLVLSGDGIYKMDYNLVQAFHVERRAGLTLVVKPVPRTHAGGYGVVEVDAEDRVRAFEEKPQAPRSNLAFLGVYLFSRDVLLEGLEGLGEADRGYDLVADVLPSLIARGEVFAYRFDGYWQDVGVLSAYYRAHMDLLGSDPALRLHDRTWPIHTRGLALPPAKFAPGARCRNSLVAEGAVVHGCVSRSVLNPRVRVDPEASVERSILLAGARVEGPTVVENAIIDEGRVVGPDTVLRRPADAEVCVVTDGGAE